MEIKNYNVQGFNFFLDLTLFISIIIKNMIKYVVVIKISCKNLEKKVDFLIINVESYYFQKIDFFIKLELFI